MLPAIMRASSTGNTVILSELDGSVHVLVYTPSEEVYRERSVGAGFGAAPFVAVLRENPQLRILVSDRSRHPHFHIVEESPSPHPDDPYMLSPVHSVPLAHMVCDGVIGTPFPTVLPPLDSTPLRFTWLNWAGGVYQYDDNPRD